MARNNLGFTDRGGPEPDSFSGSTGNDRQFGRGGDDTLSGLLGDDLLDGGAAADLLDGGGGNDTLRGGAGDDFLSGGLGIDRIEGGAGFNRVSLNFDDAVAGLSATGGFGRGATLTFSNGTVVTDASALGGVLLSRFDDRLTLSAESDAAVDGSTGDDFIDARGGDDGVFGGFGRDTLRGGDGDDSLDGGRGADTVAGGAGADTFVFGTLVRGEADRYLDFDRAEGDLLFVSLFADDNAGTGPDTVADAIAQGLLRLTDTDAGVELAFDVDGPGDGAQFTRAILFVGTTVAALGQDFAVFQD